MKVDRIKIRLDGRNEKNSNPVQANENEQELTKRREEKVVGSFCSLQKRVGPPEYRKWRRIHGLQLPLHPQQIAGWVILLTVGGASFFVMIPALRPLLRDGLFIVLGTLFGLHILSHLTALLLDPADPELRALKVNFSVPEFDRTKHAHVIENGRCHLCNIKTTSPKTKHCSVCNKCIHEFDHHCKWLNHCIGGRNYVPFLICVISAVAASLVVVAVSVLEIVYYHIDPDLLTVFPSQQHNGTAQELFLPNSVFLGIVTVLGLLAATTAGLLLHLCLFHCYISVLGISTYEYIRNYRQEANDGTQHRLDVGNNCCSSPRDVMSNRVETSTQNTRNKKFRNCCYYSFSRPPEMKAETEDGRRCLRFKSFFSRLRHCFRIGRPPKRKMLKRQSTDPEFVDKIIKPFLITLNDEKNSEAMTSESRIPETCFYKVNERKPIESIKEEVEPSEQSKRFRFTYQNLKKWRPKLPPQNSVGSGKIKGNQIRPVMTDETINQISPEQVRQMDKSNANAVTEGESKPVAHIGITDISPELHFSLKKLQSPADLKKLGDVLDMIERPRFDFHPMTRSIYRTTGRKKTFMARSRSPPLSPIRESGLSNPGSPRIDLILPPSPVFVRPSTPETSIIFLSNPNSLSSSSDDDRDDDAEDDDVVFRSNVAVGRKYRREDILQTPQLPRKTYSGGSKGEQIFITKSSKKKRPKWINMEIKNDF